MTFSDMARPLRFTTEDGLRLVGWLAEPVTNSDVAVVHVHGMSGNGFENLLVDALRSSNLAASRAFFSFNSRGAGVVTWLNRSDGSTYLGGACYERFLESALDIEAAITAVKEAGYSRIVLHGHSLGCTKVVHYMTTVADPRVQSVVLLAPTDMRGWSMRSESMRVAARYAEDMVSAGKGDQLVGETCWDNGPLSARVFHDYARAGSAVDIYETKVARKLSMPMLAVYGTEDIGIVEIDGDVETWKQRAEKAFPEQTAFAIVGGAGHGFRERLDDLTDVVGHFLEALTP